MADDDQDEPFIRAWDEREMNQLTRDLGPVLRRHGVGSVDRSAGRAEQRRVATLLGNDRAYRAQETLRIEAEMQVQSGEYANIADSVSAPTPEQFEQAKRSGGGGFRRFTPRLADGSSVRTVTAWRRKELPQVARLVVNDTISAEGFRDCLWYRRLHESTGLTGNIGSIDYGREVFTPPQARAMFGDAQTSAQVTFRAVRAQFEPRRLALLDQVVLMDAPLSRAFRSLGFRTRRNRLGGAIKAHRMFGEIVDELGQARECAE